MHRHAEIFLSVLTLAAAVLPSGLGCSRAQPSGLALAPDRLYFADSETSSIRYVDLASGQVHTLVGNLLGMGKVPWAANDPIFWLHHSNVDRLWASWNGWGRANPATAAWRDHPSREHCSLP